MIMLMVLMIPDDKAAHVSHNVLVNRAGKTAAGQLKRFLNGKRSNDICFDDLREGEHFPQSFIEIERILDVDDDALDVKK